MSGQTPVRLPLSRRQADALAVLFAWNMEGGDAPTPDEWTALREVAGKLDGLKGQQ